MAAWGDCCWGCLWILLLRRAARKHRLDSLRHCRWGCLWILLLRRAARKHRHGSLRRLTLGMFVDLIALKSRSIVSTWQLEAIAAGLFVDLIAPKSPSKPSTWQLEAIAAGDVCWSYCSEEPLETIDLAAWGDCRWGCLWIVLLYEEPLESIDLAAWGDCRWGCLWILLLRRATLKHRHGSLRRLPLGCLWILLLRRAPRNHRHGSLRWLLLGMFVDLIAPKNRWKRSTWQLEAIAAGVVCGSYCSEEPLESIDSAAWGDCRWGCLWILLLRRAARKHRHGSLRRLPQGMFVDLIAPKSRSKASTWQLEAIAAGDVCGSYCSEEPLESIDLAAWGDCRWGCLWILLLRRAPRNHRHGSLRRLPLGFFVDLIAPKSRSKASTWQLEAIAAGVVCGSYCSEEPLESIDLAAWGDCRWGCLWILLLRRAARKHRHGSLRRLPLGCLWILLLRRAPRKHRHGSLRRLPLGCLWILLLRRAARKHRLGSLRWLPLGMFVDLIAPKSPSKPSTWQLKAIAAGVLCGSYCSEEPLESIDLAAWGDCRWGCLWILLLRRAARKHRHGSLRRLPLGCLWILLLRRAPRNHQHGSLRRLMLGMFVDLIAPKNRWKRSTWQLEAITAGVVCGSYCSEEPLESIDMAAWGDCRWGCLWILLLRRAARKHRLGSLRRLPLGLFVDLIAPKSRSKASTWQLEAIAAGDVCGSYFSKEPLESIDLAAWGDCRWGCLWILLLRRAARKHRHGSLRRLLLGMFVDLISPKSRSKASNWRSRSHSQVGQAPIADRSQWNRYHAIWVCMCSLAV